MLDPRLRRRKQGRAGGLRAGADTASGGGTTVRVGGINQSSYLLAYSLTLRLGSFDFTLVNPATVPVVGDMVYLLEPAWDGQVVSVGHKDVPRGTDKFYTIVATNSKVATTSAAPFALSDVADNVTSFSYRDLTITTSRTDSGSKTQGTFTTWQQGLWPGMTFSLTSANFGLSAQTYAISNVTVTWPVKSTVPQFAIEFGDALLGLTQVAVNTGGLSTNADGTTSLRDPLGNLIFNSGSGFGSAWRRFLTGGMYNGDFAAGPADPAIGLVNPTNVLPSWTFLRVGGTGINATWVTDYSSGSGYVMRFTTAPGVADDEILLEQFVPINASVGQGYQYEVVANWKKFTADSNNITVSVRMQYFRADGSTTTGLASTRSATVSGLIQGTATEKAVFLAPPADAYYLRVQVGMSRSAGAVGETVTVDLMDVRVITTTTMDRRGGTTFPTNPDTNGDVQYYRTDLDMWFFYDGARWLSSTLYTDHLNFVGTPPYAATTSSHWLSIPLAGSLAIYIENFWVSFYVVAGTALSGSHKWTVGFVTGPGGTVTNTYTINSGAVDTWRNSGAQAVAAAVPLTEFVISGTSTKTGTPGNLYPFARITYRLIAT